MNRKHPAPKGLLAFNRQQNVLPMHGSSRPAHDSRRGSSRSRFPQTSHPSEALRVRSLSSRLTETHVTDEHRQDIPSDDFRRLEEDQAHLKEELRDTRRDLQKALDSVQQLQSDVQSLREDANAAAEKAEDPVRTLADVATHQLHVAVANQLFDENELLRSARGLIEDQNTIFIIIKLLIAGLVTLGRNQQAHAKAADDRIKEVQETMEVLGRSVEDNPTIRNIKRVSDRVVGNLGALHAEVCKHRTLDKGKAVAQKSVVDRLVDAVGEIERRMYNGRTQFQHVYADVKIDQADINDWTSRFLNILTQGPGQRKDRDRTLMDYQHKLADIQSEILMNNSLPPKEKSRYQYQIKDLQDMANYTKDTLDALESLPNSLSLPPPARPVLMLKGGRKRQAESSSRGDQSQEKRLRFDRP